MASKKEKLKKIREQVWNLEESSLYKYRKKNSYYPVLGQGNHDADIMFIGEAPGRNEAESGIPFCGAAGKILDKLLNSVDINREDVYITNIVKDRPPGNRDPKPGEIELYAPFLVKQIRIIKPQIIATLGRFSMEFVMKLFGLEDKLDKISSLHGRVFEAQAQYGTINIVPLYHPAVAIYNRNQFPTLKSDFEILINLVDLV